MKNIRIAEKIKNKMQIIAAVMTMMFAFGTAAHASTCVWSSGSWANDPLSQTATGSFRVSFDAEPSAALSDGVMGLSLGSAIGYTSLAVIVRFNDTGTIDARNGAVYAAVAKIPYLAGTPYHFILDVNAAAHTYNAYVIIGSVQTKIASNFVFRSEQATTSSLSNLGAVETVGSLRVCNAALSLSTVAPSITSQPVSRTVIAGNAAAFTVAASGTAPLTFQWKKNGVAIGGATSSAYTTPAETTTDNNAQFTVAVSNAAGRATSNVATLGVSAATFLLSCNTSSLNFGSVNVSSNSAKTVTFTNAGNSTVTVSHVTVSGAGFNAGGISSGLMLTPGQTASLTATFAPSGSGSVTGSVSVASNATNSPDSVSLSGTGVAVVNHSVGLSWLPSTSKVMGYNTYSSEQSGGPYTKLTSTPLAETSYSDTAVLGGKTYYFVVTSVDSSNMESGYSSEVSALVP
jgi:Abnormal spindle-like microcephaly-assoc'd, ASPM-SPD-2-Hydin